MGLPRLSPRVYVCALLSWYVRSGRFLAETCGVTGFGEAKDLGCASAQRRKYKEGD